MGFCCKLTENYLCGYKNHISGRAVANFFVTSHNGFGEFISKNLVETKIYAICGGCSQAGAKKGIEGILRI
jgi:hypothetical protein